MADIQSILPWPELIELQFLLDNSPFHSRSGNNLIKRGDTSMDKNNSVKHDSTLIWIQLFGMLQANKRSVDLEYLEQ